MNKITNLDHINDLVIQFYEIKRDKLKQKKLKDKARKEPKPDKGLIDSFNQKYAKYAVGGTVSFLLVAGLLAYKFNR
jgi:hypothetical protein